MPDLEGQQLGNYQLIRLLGQGGFAHVYLGEHIYLKTLAAVKVLDVRVGSTEDSERFVQEARTIAELRHPNIIRVLDFAVVNDVPFLVMDYAPNDTLARLHPRGTPLPPATVVTYVKQVAAALQYAHDRKKLIHCDVKPANMLLGANNEVLLSDFGIALTSPSSRAPSIEQILGTLAYMAPEHLSGRPVLASDQYSLGIVVYEWLSGTMPFSGNQIELFSRHNFATPPPLTGKVPPLVEQVVLRALAKLPYQRYPRVQDFADALEDAVQRSNQPAGPLVLGLSGPLAPFNRVSPSTATQQATLGAFQPTPGSPPLFPPVSHQASPLPPRSGDYVTLPDQPARTPASLSPTTSGAPPLPDHALIQREHALIREVYEVVREYEARKVEAQRVYDEEERAATREQQASLAQADQEIDVQRQRLQDALRRVRERGWERWAKIYIPFLQSLLASPPLAIAPTSTPAQQLSFCTSAIDESSGSIGTFLGRYNTPGKLFRRNLYPAGAAAILCFVISGALCGFAQNLLFAAGVALIVFGGIWLSLSLRQLKPIRAAYVHLEQAVPLLERVSQEQHALLEEAYQRRRSEARDRRRDMVTQLEQTWQWHLNRLSALFSSFVDDLGFAAASWNDPRWDAWQPVNTINTSPPVARIGTLAFPDVSGFPPLPALLSCPAGCNLFIKAQGAGKMAALATMQSLTLRLLATQPPGKVHLTLIEPVGLGRYVDAFLQLAEHHEMLGTGRVWVDDQEIEQQLRALTQHIRRIIQEHSRNQYLATQEFNTRLGESNEPYHVLVIIGFPTNFTARAANDLLTIAQNGPRCGVSTLILADLDRPLGPMLSGFDSRVLENMANVLTWDGQRFLWQDPHLQGCQLELDAPPPQPQFNRLLQEIGRQTAITSSIEQNTLLSAALASPTWQRPREQRTSIWLGHPMVAKEPTALALRRESSGNLLIVGQQEEIAVSLLTSSIVSLAAQLPPERLHCYVLDLSTIHDPPDSPFELLRQLLPRHVRQVLSRRHLRTSLAPLMTMMSESVEARRTADDVDETSIYFIICGLQRLDDLRQRADAQAAAIAQQFMHIVRRGSDLGVHILAWCDKYSNLKDLPGEHILEYFDARVVFHTTTREESEKLIERPDAAALDPAYAICFDHGRLEKFRPYALPSREWLTDAAQKISQKDRAM